jgi:hypothetical protein
MRSRKSWRYQSKGVMRSRNSWRYQSKGVIRSRKSKNFRQYNGQKKKNKRINK